MGRDKLGGWQWPAETMPLRPRRICASVCSLIHRKGFKSHACLSSLFLWGLFSPSHDGTLTRSPSTSEVTLFLFVCLFVLTPALKRSVSNLTAIWCLVCFVVATLGDGALELQVTHIHSGLDTHTHTHRQEVMACASYCLSVQPVCVNRQAFGPAPGTLGESILISQESHYESCVCSARRKCQAAQCDTEVLLCRWN